MRAMYLKGTRSLLAAAIICAVPCSYALTPTQMSQEELSALPRWCAYTQSFERNANAPGHFDDLVKRYGPGWTHVHHYCWALGSMIRHSQFGTSAQAKSGLVSSALNDIKYVLDRVPEDFVLRNEIMTKMARILIVAGSPDAALKVAEEAVAQWPAKADSYGLVAESLLALKRRGEAKKALDDAASRVNDKDRLHRIRTALNL